MSFRLFIFFLLGQIIISKTTSDIFPIAIFIRENNFMYLNKMDFGIGEGQIKFQIKLKGRENQSHNFSQIYIGLAIDQKYQQLSNSLTCKQKQKFMQQTHKLDLSNEKTAILNVKIVQTVREHIWYYYLYSCEQKVLTQKDNFFLRFYVDITSFNNGSHFGQDQKIIWAYIISLCITLLLIPRNIKKLKKDLGEQQYDYAHICITVGIISLSAGYFYKFIHLLYYSRNGYGISVLDVLFLISRTISQSIVMTLLIIIGWGWTINFIRTGNQELFAPFAALGAIINIVCTAIGKITDDGQQKNHHFDCVTGKILLFFRSLMVIAFLIGIFRTYRQARPKTKKFVRQFGILSFIYIAIYPLSVLFCELVFPPYMQNQFITGITEITHSIANGLLTFMITSSKSSYTNLQYHSRSVFTSTEDGKVF